MRGVVSLAGARAELAVGVAAPAPHVAVLGGRAGVGEPRHEAPRAGGWARALSDSVGRAEPAAGPMPQQSTAPSARSAQPWSAPKESCATSGMPSAARWSTPPAISGPSPPQQKATPVSWTTRVKSVPRRRTRPRGTHSTCVRGCAPMRLPVPHWAWRLSPQHWTLPLARSAQACSLPRATSRMPGSAATVPCRVTSPGASARHSPAQKSSPACVHAKTSPRIPATPCTPPKSGWRTTSATRRRRSASREPLGWSIAGRSSPTTSATTKPIPLCCERRCTCRRRRLRVREGGPERAVAARREPRAEGPAARGADAGVVRLGGDLDGALGRRRGDGEGGGGTGRRGVADGVGLPQARRQERTDENRHAGHLHRIRTSRPAPNTGCAQEDTGSRHRSATQVRSGLSAARAGGGLRSIARTPASATAPPRTSVAR